MVVVAAGVGAAVAEPKGHRELRSSGPALADLSSPVWEVTVGKRSSLSLRVPPVIGLNEGSIIPE